MDFVFLANPGTQLVCGAGLAKAGNIVELALDRHQGGVLDRRRIHAFTRDILQPARQQMFLKHHAYGVEVILRRHIEHSVVFVVETAVRIGVVEVAFD